ncbi:hypothetical protein K504DRAFT_504141 [Pleomassaria siparia CBS 279.74]|uniref:Uncharacterized protein n=1 Tax=Pleomassaria siparia CBS 279.74 TaxID=1314801 RepID=A0A6G1K5Y1_9PLEO|nr:hypothetical protein K504DRAFT_504141 [Pleomassaria siparia CBS 279.74]
MLDPFTALGLASNILQVLEFTGMLVREGVERYQSANGSTKEDVGIEDITSDLAQLTEPMRRKQELYKDAEPEHISQEELKLLDLATKCHILCEDLCAILDDLKTDPQARFRQLSALRKTIRRQRKGKAIRSLEKKMDMYRSQLNTRILANISQSSSDLSRTMNDLSKASSSLAENTAEALEDQTLTLIRIKTEILAALEGLNVTSNKDTVMIKLSELSRTVQNFIENGHRLTNHQIILKSLYFKGVGHRHGNQVSDAEEETFEWAYEEGGDVPLHQWLQEEEGFFWISGKPGSGKSTFIKFVSHDRRTEQALQTWGRRVSKQVVTVEYYFWNNRNLEQKSQRGMLRSLLFQILRQIPEIISLVCPGRSDIQYDFLDSLTDHWTPIELQKSFRRLVQLPSLPLRFCIFIDGLDEFDSKVGDGEHTDMLEVLKQVKISPDIKLCLSTRPWSFVTRDLENTHRKIFMENLTKGCIENYARRRLRSGELVTLVPEIVRKSEGVFLWVFLVVRNLLKGLENADTVQELREKLDHIPSDLEKFFRRSIELVERDYREQSAQVFEIAVGALQPLSIFAYRCFDYEREDSNYALKAAIKPYHNSLPDFFNQMRKRLHARAIDLLEVNDTSSDDSFLRYRVTFIHRTLNEVFSLVDETAYYAQQIHQQAESGCLETYEDAAVPDLLDELDRVVSIYAREDSVHWTNRRDTLKGMFVEGRQCTFLAYTIQTNQKAYVEKKLAMDPSLLKSKRGRPYLDYVLRPGFVTPTPWPIRDALIDVDMIRTLLERKVQIQPSRFIFMMVKVLGVFSYQHAGNGTKPSAILCIIPDDSRRQHKHRP